MYDKTQEHERRFWSKVDKGLEADSCWNWTGCKHSFGYGRIGTMVNYKPDTHYAHRVSWEWHRGQIPEDLFVCHRCDNPSCVKPDHLFLGSPQDNVEDMASKGRHVGSRKLSNADVMDIRTRFANNESAKSLGEKYQMHPQHIRAIARGRFYPNLGGPLTQRKLNVTT